MKLMTKLLLVHWHYFVREVIEFDKVNFLTGKNASGKSTIIDALQLLLLCDTSGSFFNKAASGRGNRTLSGYLRGELGDDEDSGFRYLRDGRFTSYIALEFFDEEKKKSFTIGCCFDTYSENDMQKLFFRFDGAIPSNEFVVNKKPMEIMDLRAYIKEHYATGHSYTTNVNRDFKQDLYGKLGGLRDRFGQLLKKAVSFNPNVDIQQFISEFVCDTQQTVDVSRMQENIRSYKSLEQEAAVLKDRIALLDQILTTHQNFETHRQNEVLYSYLVDRARADIKMAAIAGEKDKAAGYSKQLAELMGTLETENRRQSKLQDERDIMQAKLLNNEQAQILEHLQTQITAKEQQISALRGEFGRTSAMLSKSIASWRINTDGIIRKIKGTDTTSLDPLLTTRIHNLVAEGQQFYARLATLDNSDAAAILAVGEGGLIRYTETADAIRMQSSGLVSRLFEEQQKIADYRKALQVEQQSLESGVYHFPQDVLDLKEAVSGRLRTKTGTTVKVVIVAEAAELRNNRWRNVIEGYLNTQKFYLIVPPEHFDTALRVYDGIKRQRSIYGTGIVDIEKLKRINPAADPGSLAEELETDDPNVRLFLDFTLGRVKKCDRVGDLRRHRTSITDDGMLYQNFVVRAMNPDRWAKPAIGRGAIRQRLEDVKREIAALTGKISICASVKTAFQLGGYLLTLSESDAGQIVAAAKNFGLIPELEQEIALLNKNMESVDKSAVEAMRERIRTLDQMLKTLREQIDTHKDEYSTIKERLRVCRDETIPRLSGELTAMELQFSEKYEAEWLENTGNPRYQRELSGRGNAIDIERAFPRELSRSTNAKTAMWDELRNLRRQYNDKYIMGYDINDVNNDAYDNAWLELSDIKLPEYLTRIEDARSKAFEQFQEDFLSRLQNNINDAKRQIDGLNSALSGSSFGEDTYRFRIIPKPEYKRYYDMIVDPMLLEGGYNLLSNQFNAKYKEEIAELFAIITNEGTGSKAQERDDYEKRVQAFTDYRTYLSFDLEVINREGESQRLSKTLGKKSGGETQTPFYIAVLASFAQLYRVGRDKTANTSRIILFDEAFSKMDGERIVRSVELLRRFNFQAVLSAPPDKIGDIATLVDRNLCVLREGRHACVRSFDPRKLEELDYDQI
ncbi:MAG: SbcC/MukB-like Walker B domain-containing protein [Bacillota bacterium]